MLNKYLDIIKKKGSSGFTLIELLIVISIIGILVTIVVIAVDPAAILQRTNDTKKRSELTQIKTALQLYFNENNDYPATGSLASLSPDYMRQDPTAFDYTVNYSSNGTDYDAGVDLEKPDAVGNDGKTYDKCQPLIASGPTQANSDYFICPD